MTIYRHMLKALLIALLCLQVHAQEVVEDPVRIECEESLKETLGEMLEALVKIRATMEELELDGYEALVEQALASHAANVELCVAGVQYFQGLAESRE